jgi:hypothetical protein
MIPKFFLDWIDNKDNNAIIDFLDNENDQSLEFYFQLLLLSKKFENKTLTILLIKINYLLKTINTVE